MIFAQKIKAAKKTDNCKLLTPINAEKTAVKFLKIY